MAADPYFTPNRAELIDEILQDLNSGRYKEHGVAVKHLVDFFEAAKSPFSYAMWLLFKAPFLKQYDLLELTDLGNQRWNEIFYPLMIATERLPFPGLVKPLVDALTDTLGKGEVQHVIQLGSGPMEIERQVIENLRGKGLPLHFVGIDLSPYAHAFARKNLESSGIKVEQTIDLGQLHEKLRKSTKETHVTLYLGDGIKALQSLQLDGRHLVFHSLFRHHLSERQKQELELSLRASLARDIEYDGFRSIVVAILFSIGTWGNPIIMNGAIFSNRRYDRKRIVKVRFPNTRFLSPSGAYLGSRRST